MKDIDDVTTTELEAAAFRRLTALLRDRTDVQNIDLMNLAGFCRNCLSTWIEEAARERGLPVGKADAREHVYGMPYEAWRERYQREATPEQRQAFAAGVAAAHPEPAEPAREPVDPAARAANV